LLCAAALMLVWRADDAAAQMMSAGPAPATPAQTTQAQTAQAQPAQAQPAQAQPMPQPAPPPKILDEVKLGLLAHDIGFLGHHVESGEDVNMEVLFTSPSFLRWILSPRPHIGADINGSDNTSNYYAGLTWGWTFYRPGWNRGDGFFANLSFGGSYNDGETSTTDPHRKSLGSHELFKEGIDIGYQLNEVVSIAGYIDHISNADLAPKNAGITNAGLRLGYKF
jgi:lipid A 3-O-deacylase